MCELAPGFAARLPHADRVTLAHVTVAAGTTLPAHAHPHEQVSTVLADDFERMVGGETRRRTPATRR